MKVNLIVGARYHAPTMAAILAKIVDLKIYTSVPSSYWPGLKESIKIVPHISILYAKILHRSPSRSFKDFSTRLFSKLAALRMRSDVDVVYAWATFGREAMKQGKKRGAKVILERSCPHIDFQEHLLSEEAEILGIKFERSDPHFVQRCKEEYDLADIIVVPSSYTKRTFVEKGFPESKLRMVRLGPNFQPKIFGPTEILGRRENFTVGVVAGSVLRKGLLYLLRAWEKLELPNAILKLKCAEIELRKSPEVTRLLSSLSNVEIVGYVDNMEDFYRSCDLFCLPSVDEGFGMVVFEAIACGCPVIVTDNVGAADIVKPGKTGYIVEARNPNVLGEKIRELYENREKLIEMAQECSRFYKEYQNSNTSYFHQVEDLVAELQTKI